MADVAASEPVPGWARAAILALVLHLAVIGGAMLTLHSPPLEPAGAPFVVTMAAPPTDVAPGPTQDEATPQPIANPETDLPLPPPDSSAPSAIRLPQPTERPIPKTPAPPAPAAVAVTSRPPAAPPGSQPAPPTAARGAASDAWQARLLAQLERNKRYPARARYFRQQDTVYVQFSMDRRGKVLSSKIIKSAGYADIDAEVLALIKRAQPLVPPPDDVPGDPVTRMVAIQFYLS